MIRNGQQSIWRQYLQRKSYQESIQGACLLWGECIWWVTSNILSQWQKKTFCQSVVVPLCLQYEVHYGNYGSFFEERYVVVFWAGASKRDFWEGKKTEKGDVDNNVWAGSGMMQVKDIKVAKIWKWSCMYFLSGFNQPIFRRQRVQFPNTSQHFLAFLPRFRWEYLLVLIAY